jgi:hypothetical protein
MFEAGEDGDEFEGEGERVARGRTFQRLEEWASDSSKD